MNPTPALATFPSLRGQRVFITGGATGIGAAMVEAFAQQGAQVAFVDVAEAEGDLEPVFDGELEPVGDGERDTDDDAVEERVAVDVMVEVSEKVRVQAGIGADAGDAFSEEDEEPIDID